MSENNEEKKDQIKKELKKNFEFDRPEPFASKQDRKWGIGDLEKTFPLYEGVMGSLFGNWKEMYSFATRIAIDKVHLPKHFWGNPQTLMMTWMKGLEIGIMPMEAQTVLIPLYGFWCMRGDAIKERILRSGKCAQKGGWVITETGSIDRNSYSVTVSSKRIDPPAEREITFDFKQFQKAGLYISVEMYDQLGKAAFTDSQLIRYEYPERTMLHMAQSWLARDLYADVLNGIRMYEEVEQYKSYETVIDKDGDGKIIVGKQMEYRAVSMKRSESLLDLMQVSGQMDTDPDGRLKVISENVTDMQKQYEDKLFDENNMIKDKEKYTREELLLCKGGRAKFLNAILSKRGVHLEFLPTTKRIALGDKRDLILAQQEGEKPFDMYITKRWSSKALKSYQSLVREFNSGDPESVKTDNPEVFQEKGDDAGWNFLIPNLDPVSRQRGLTSAGELGQQIRNFISDDDADFLKRIKEMTLPEGVAEFESIADFCKRSPVNVVKDFLRANRS